MPKKCFYEVLGVENSSTFDDIKKVYKKLALKWHPDKNIGCEDRAREEFLLVQQAYEVLSNPQERAWYDRHKDQILGDDDQETDSYNVFPYFTASCYSGFHDGDDGFYTVYRNVFNNIAEEDEAAVGRGQHSAPTFGNSTSSYPEVVEPFYNYWSNYCTKRNFAWVDDKLRREDGRRINRIVERENRKKRESLKKERNEEVRKLVSFVKKRDKRVIAWSKRVQEEKSEKLRKAEQLRVEQILRNRQANESYKGSEWSNFSELEGQLGDIEKSIEDYESDSMGSNSEESDEESSKPRPVFCVACKKLFNSEKAFANHENSKKHKQNVSLLSEDDDD